VYLHDPDSRVAHPFGLLAITLAGEQISAITRFGNAALTAFALPATLPT
jgi:RNA polymerase sigma-70 factor, ECF subfamily